MLVTAPIIAPTSVLCRKNTTAAANNQNRPNAHASATNASATKEESATSHAHANALNALATNNAAKSETILLYCLIVSILRISTLVLLNLVIERRCSSAALNRAVL